MVDIEEFINLIQKEHESCDEPKQLKIGMRFVNEICYFEATKMMNYPEEFVINNYPQRKLARKLFLASRTRK